MAPGQVLDRFLDQLRRVPRQALALSCGFVFRDARNARRFIRIHEIPFRPWAAKQLASIADCTGMAA
jgi:hypothetical protein